MRKLSWLGLIAVVAIPQAARATDKGECVAEHERGQLLRNAGKLLEARAAFVRCATSSCPAPVRKDCAEWQQELMPSIPSVVLAATGEQGRELLDVRASVDGAPWLDRLDARAHELDPGQHTFRLETADGRVKEETLTLHEGEKDRRVSVSFAPAAPPAPAPELPPTVVATSRPVPLASFVAGGIGIVALGGFAGFGLAGHAKENDLRASCSPRCAPDQVNQARTDYLVANVSVAVAAVALGTAVVFFARRPSAPPSPVAWIGLQGAPGGFLVGAGGAL